MHTSQYKKDKENDFAKTFVLSLQHPDNFPLVSLNGITIETGKKTR
jgi:hypothetical protein